jgi:2,4-dienoyl-CoA reductase-like NADH-dependent reductase (Old Yellow Enzyme family)
MKRGEITRREFLRGSLGVAVGVAAGSFIESRPLAQAEQKEYASIFEPTSINGLVLKNRLVRSSTWEAMATPEGAVTDRFVDLYSRLAAGGVGAIHTGYMYVRRDGQHLPFQTGIDRDERIAGLARLAEAVHQQGGKIVGQIVHCGGQADRRTNGGQQPVAPSGVASPGYTEIPRALTEKEVEEMISLFAAAAGRVKAAGCDGVEIHGAHGYLVSRFLSPYSNRRTDRFGGSLENRARFALEVYKAVRAEVGPSFPVLIKLNAHDRFEGSTTERDAAYLASALAQAGIDAIEVSSGTCADIPGTICRPDILSWKDEAYNLSVAKYIRSAAPKVPLMLVGGLRSLEKMECILNNQDADYFSISRPLIRQPDLPARWRDGDRARATCISCNGCFGPALKGEGIRCVIEGA